MPVMLFPKQPGNANFQLGWSSQEIAEFYRIVDVLSKAGLAVDTDNGKTDEGDPWFVFIQPNTGEVVAHFARIDAQIVAVSSLSQEIYKGGDIRAIVDAMLLSHPVLLPKGNGSNRLLLHPSAALVAFVAAAVLLSVDGVKAQGINDVMEVLVGETVGIEKLVTNSKISNLKEETTRAIVNDLKAMGYNVSTLGAALFPIETTAFEGQISLTAGYLENSWDAIISPYDPKDKLVGALPTSPFDQYGYFLSLPHSEVGIEGGTLAKKQDFDTLVDLKKTVMTVEDNTLELDTVSEIILSEPGAHLINGIGSDGVLVPDVTDPLSYVSSINRGIPNFASELSFIADQPSTDLVLSGLEGLADHFSDIVQTVYDTFEKLVGGGNNEKLPASTGLGLAFGVVGNLVVLDLEKPNDEILFEDAAKESSSFFMGIDDLLFSKQIDFEIIYEAQPNVTSVSDQQSTQVPMAGLEMVGHNVSALGLDTLTLTNAIDIVFYSGGTAKVAEFELGKDLLWLLMEPSTLDKIEAVVENGTDLMLNFSDVGSLKLIDVLGHSSDYEIL